MSKISKQTVNEVNVNALESAAPATRLTKSKKSVSSDGIDFKDLNFLRNNNPLDHIDGNDKNIVSSQYKEEREPKVQEGLEILSNIKIGDKPISELMLLIGKWWEHKQARNYLKTLIDTEAEENGYDSATYIQNILGGEIEALAEIQNAINRLKYVKTYFKPRAGKVSKKTTQIKIDGDIYSINVTILSNLRAQYGENKEGLKAAILDVAVKSESILEL